MTSYVGNGEGTSGGYGNANGGNTGGSGSGPGGGGDGDGDGGSYKNLDTGKYVRYTSEQVEALEKVYMDCPKPSSSRRQQLVRESPILANIEPKQIKVWFQNRRCREKQRKESSRLHTVNKKLSAMNKLLMEENDRLQKQVSQLVYDNSCLRQQLQYVSGTTTDASCESVVTTPPQRTLRDANNPAGLLSIAEETLVEFLSKAKGTAVDWVQIPGMKPGPDSVGIISVSHNCTGVAARACGLVSLEPTKIMEILKDRPGWFRDCRNHDVVTIFPSGNGGMIELIYMQMYAPTTLAPARDFWTLRYTTNLEDGSLVVCERSLSGHGAGPNVSSSSQCVRSEMLPSGYLIRPCDGGGSIMHIVDHLDLEAWSVPEVLRPLYQSSEIVAQKLTIAALHHLRQIAQEAGGEVAYSMGRQPTVLRTFSQRLSRGFNDAVNGFSEDGWSIVNCDGSEDVITSVEYRNLGPGFNPANLASFPGVLCVKASLLLQNVPPALLVCFLREHRSEWADYNMDEYSAAAIKASLYNYPEIRQTRFSGSQIIMPLVQTVEQEETLEVIRLEGHVLTREEAGLSRNIHLLQICRGTDEAAVGVFSELIFAPIDEMFPDDSPLIPSGFRIIPLETRTDNHRTLDLASSLEMGPSTSRGIVRDALVPSRSVLTIAFQFPFEHHLQDAVADMARQYVRRVISSVQRVAMAISPPIAGTQMTLNVIPVPDSPEALTLSQWICQSYSYHSGAQLLKVDNGRGDSILKLFWEHPDAVLCCSLKSPPMLTFGNQAGIGMLETSLLSLQDISLDKIFDDSGQKSLNSYFPKIIQQGFAYLPGGICFSTMGRHISYEQAVAWKVFGDDNNVHCLAFSFIKWSFL